MRASTPGIPLHTRRRKSHDIFGLASIDDDVSHAFGRLDITRLGEDEEIDGGGGPDIGPSRTARCDRFRWDLQRPQSTAMNE